MCVGQGVWDSLFIQNDEFKCKICSQCPFSCDDEVKPIGDKYFPTEIIAVRELRRRSNYYISPFRFCRFDIIDPHNRIVVEVKHKSEHLWRVYNVNGKRQPHAFVSDSKLDMIDKLGGIFKVVFVYILADISYAMDCSRLKHLNGVRDTLPGMDGDEFGVFYPLISWDRWNFGWGCASTRT